MKCSSCIVDEYYKSIRKERAGLQDMPRGAKGWWRKSKRLMQKKGNMSSIPALKNAENQWVLGAECKADVQYLLTRSQANVRCEQKK